VRISKDNYINRQAAISLDINPIHIDIIGIENFYASPKGVNITITLDLINSLTREFARDEHVQIKYGDNEYTMLINQTSGQYYWIIDTNNYNVLAIAESFEVVVRILTNENFTSSEISFIVQIDPPIGWFGLPQIYWIIIGAVASLAIGIYSAARVISYSKIPTLVKYINTTSKSIKKDKKFRNTDITKNRNEFIEDYRKKSYDGFTFKGESKKQMTNEDLS
jgi:hypothetical protein